MAKYRSYDYSQGVLIPVSLEEQLVPGTLEFAIHTLVETRINTSIFDRRYQKQVIRENPGLQIHLFRQSRKKATRF